MKVFIQMPDNDRRAMFLSASKILKISSAIVEKDFWVCYILDYLFHRSPWAKSFAFKGGTALSRIYHLTDRFSEDIDLILDWRLLGYGFDEPWADRSKTKQEAFNKEANRRAETFLSNDFVPRLRSDISVELGHSADIQVDENDPQVVIFTYPRIFSETYILPVIRIEAGALSAWTPAKEETIRPYVSEAYPDKFKQPETKVICAAPERTFWEKATILHHEAHRPKESPMPKRYSRHYYDMYKLSASDVKHIAFERLDLLQKVVDFKSKFYPRNWAKYSEAKPGTIILVPPEYRIEELRMDYTAMQEMIFANIPSFDEVMKTVACLEDEINSL